MEEEKKELVDEAEKELVDEAKEEEELPVQVAARIGGTSIILDDRTHKQRHGHCVLFCV